MAVFYQFAHPAGPDYWRVETGENFSFPPHLHACFELLTVQAGEMTVTVDGREYPLSAGESLLLFPHQIHALDSENSRHTLCIFSPQLVHAFTKHTAGLLPRNNRCDLPPDTATALQAADSGSLIVKKGVLYTLCGRFDDTAEYTPRSQAGDTLLHKIFAFVETAFAEDCSLGALAAATGYDYAYLSRTFRRLVGISFNTYVNHYRLSHACYLLKNTDKSVLQCALDSGFTTLRSFNRNFKEQFGISPSAYRKEA